MLIPIVINSQDILDQYNNISKQETEDVCDLAVKNLTAAFYEAWVNEAEQSLKATRSRYIQNLSLIDSGRLSGAIVLSYKYDPLIKMIEEGREAFDMKTGFANSSKKHIKKDGGWWLTIPFSQGTPGADSSAFTNILPSQVYNVVKAKPVSLITNQSQGLTTAELPNQFAGAKTRAAIPKSEIFLAYQHKSSIYTGVIKKTDAVTGQNSYHSFRRVSDKSDANAWIFPGFEAKNLAETTWDKFQPRMQQVLEDSMNSALQAFGFID